MTESGESIIEAVVEDLAVWLLTHNYSIDNEMELRGLFVHKLVTRFSEGGLSPSGIKSEIKLLTLNAEGRTKVKASIDLGIRVPRTDGTFCQGYVEAKTWIRPDYEGVLAPNSSTSKRKQCIADGRRLLQFTKHLQANFNGLLIYERGSTHLRRCVPEGLSAENIKVVARWFDISRPSLGRKKEHLGIIWLEGVI